MFVSKTEVENPDALVAQDLGVSIGFVRQVRQALEEVFGDHAVGLTHIAAFVLNYSDMPAFTPFVNWVRNHKQMIMQRSRLPKYIERALEQMSRGGCSLILHGKMVKLSDEMCFKVLVAIAAVLLYMVRIYSRHGIWVVLEEGAGIGDVHVILKGENDGDQ
ncbi:MAG: hypothetical protein L7G96_05930 [Vulcanisaeta sp.]|nr:hypothetical protein [Vulcanisaeta sp.]